MRTPRHVAFLGLIAALAAYGQGTRTAAPRLALKAGDPVVSQFEDGAPLAGTQRVVPGETVFFRFAVTDFVVGENAKVRLNGHAQIFDPRGIAISPPDENGVAGNLREEDKDWKPRFHFQFQLPSLAPSGLYKVRYDAVDEIGKGTAKGETTFQVDGRDVLSSPTLVIRNLAFYRSSDDETPARTVSYRAGDMVWMKFDITGYKYGEQHSMDVAYDVAVTSPDGKQLFRQENAAVERNQAYYPQPWVPGAFSLNLQANMRVGEYTVTITAHDGVGKQEISGSASFRVE